MQAYLLSIIVFLPLLGVVAILLLRGDDHLSIRRIALVVSVIDFLFSLAVLPGFRMGDSGYQFEELHGWISRPPIPYHLGVDGISLFLVILTTFLTPLAILCSWSLSLIHISEPTRP